MRGSYEGVYKLVITGGINVETLFNSPLNIPIEVVLDINYLFNNFIPSEILSNEIWLI